MLVVTKSIQVTLESDMHGIHVYTQGRLKQYSQYGFDCTFLFLMQVKFHMQWLRKKKNCFRLYKPSVHFGPCQPI